MRDDAFHSMDDVARFRAKAEECRREAQQMSLSTHRDIFLKLAREWDAMADSLEEQAKNPERAGPTEGDPSS